MSAATFSDMHLEKTPNTLLPAGVQHESRRRRRTGVAAAAAAAADDDDDDDDDDDEEDGSEGVPVSKITGIFCLGVPIETLTKYCVLSWFTWPASHKSSPSFPLRYSSSCSSSRPPPTVCLFLVCLSVCLSARALTTGTRSAAMG